MVIVVVVVRASEKEYALHGTCRGMVNVNWILTALRNPLR